MKHLWVGKVVLSGIVAFAWLTGALASAAATIHKRTVLFAMESAACGHGDYVPHEKFKLYRHNKDVVKWVLHNDCATTQRVALCSYVKKKLDKGMFEKCSEMNTVFSINSDDTKRFTCKGKKDTQEGEPAQVVLLTDPTDNKCPDDRPEEGVAIASQTGKMATPAAKAKILMYHAIDIEIAP